MAQQPRDLHLKPAAKATESTPKPEPTLSSSVSKKLVWKYAPSPDGLDSNLLIFLHGLGDTHLPFFALGQSLKLPQTAILSLRAPDRIPLLPEEAFQWVHSFTEIGEVIDRPDPTPAVDLIKKLFRHLQQDCGWPSEALHLFGFAQGGSIAAESALAAGLTLGSVVSVGGPLFSFPTPSKKSTTPVLVWRRSDDKATATGPFRQGFEKVSEHIVPGRGQGMPRSQPEWLPIMK